MSYSTIKAVWPGQKSEKLEELANSHGLAPVVWGTFAERYLGGRNNWLFKSEELWPLANRSDIPVGLRAVLIMTFDKVYVEKKDYPRAAADIEAFLQVAPSPPNHVNHWPRIVEIFKSNPDVPAIGFWCTSVSEDPYLGDWNEEIEEYNQPNWDDFASVYDQDILAADRP